MKKNSIKLKNYKYWDSSSIMHNRKLLSDILNYNKRLLAMNKSSGSKTYISGNYIPFNDEIYNNSNGKIVFENNGLITINHTGYIKISFNVWIYAAASARPWIRLNHYNKNITIAEAIDDNSSQYITLGVSNVIVKVDSGDTFGVEVLSAANFNINKGSGCENSYITIEIIE